MLRTSFAVTAFSLVAQLAATAQIPAFPGAEGFGAYATGGRGGDVYYVTNRNTSGAGSLANGIANAPAAGRTIVFAVSGYIPIPSSGLRITKPKITIAGQTAPGDGIGLRNGTFRVSANDVVLRHLRLRHGKNGSGGDCLNLDSASNRCVIDHCSLQFSTDENFSSFSSPPDYMTFQWSINAWGLVNHSAGGLWDQNRASCLHSLWAHNHTRNPKARPNTLLDWVNNVTFDWDIGFIMGDSETPASWKANVRNSYFLCPPGNLRLKSLEKARIATNGIRNFSLHLNNCRHDYDGDGQLNGTDKGYAIASGDYTTLASPVANTGSAPVGMADPVTAFKRVASASGALRPEAGSSRPLRDEVDTRLANNVLNQIHEPTGSEADLGLPNSGFGNLNSTVAPIDTDLDGMPNNFENALGWNPASQDHNTALPNSGGYLTGLTFMPVATPAGYTRLEEYLHFLAIPHAYIAKNTASDPTFIDIDLRKFTAGFVKSPTFTLGGITNGTATQSGTGNAIVRFTPTQDFSGRSRFEFTVTDAEGSSWTQTCALLVTVGGLPRDLLWKGGLSSNAWDTTTQNWLRNGTATTFAPGDFLTFDDSGSKSPAVNVTTALSPGGIEVNANGNYSFNGTGAIASTGPLLKAGTGTLTLGNSAANSFTTIALDQGAITIGNSNSLGSAIVTLGAGTTLNMGSHAPTAATINVGGDATVTGGHSGGTHGIGKITGSALVTVNQTAVFDLEGDISAFAGEMRFTGNSPIRFNGSGGSALATFNLLGGTTIYKRSTAATIELGGLAGTTGTGISGSNGSTTPTTYVIGGNNASTSFAGNISDGGGTVHLTKTGSGMWTFAGISTHTGTTTINAGTLALSGTITNSNPITLSAGATLAMQGGSANVGGVTVPSTSYLTGWGSVSGGVTLNGTFQGRGVGTGTPGMLAVSGGLTLAAGSTTRLRLDPAGHDQIQVTGNLTLDGTLVVTLTPGALTGTRTLFTYSGSLTNNVIDLAGLPAGVTGSINTATPGQVNLVLVADDNLPDEWETFWFGNLTQGDSGDPDLDGHSNLTEMLAASNPNLAASTPLDTDADGILDSFEIIRPYQPDPFTLQLWHFDTFAAPVPNAADPAHPLLGIHNGAILWKPGPGGFGSAVDTNTGTSPNKGIVTYAAALSSATTPDTPATFSWHGENGAFTMEAVVKLSSLPSTWTLPGQIISMDGDGDGSQDRVFQFRINPNSGSPVLEFFPLASGVSGLVQGTLPTSGIHAPNTSDWFHVAVTYDGNPGAPDNLKVYWTRLVEEVPVANEIGSGSLAAGFSNQQGDFAIGNEARSTGGSTEFFPGLIDEARISSIARQPDDFFFKPADSDDDGFPDAWEFYWFGNIVAIGNPEADEDDDGFTNQQEYVAGSNPDLPASTPADMDGDGIADNLQNPQPYQPDAHTLHLWHLDETAPPFLNAANPAFHLQGAHNGVIPWPPGHRGFGTGINTNTGTNPDRGIVTFAPTLDSATTADTSGFIWHGANGAFTLEAMVKFETMPTTWNISGHLLSMEGDGSLTQDRVFQFRIDPGGGVPILQFQRLNTAVESINAPLPLTGPHAVNTSDWFHIAAAYDGNAGTNGNMKLYFTKVTPSTIAAMEMTGRSGFLTNDFANPQGDLSIGNEARANGGHTECFQGTIDEVRISSIARAPTAFVFTADADKDSLPDAWEVANFGNLSQSAADDFDKDGTSNRAEFLLGLNPASGSSSFRATPGGPPSPGFTLTWPTAPGLSFRIERSTTLTGTWTGLGTVQAGTFTDPNPPAGSAFYRVILLTP